MIKKYQQGGKQQDAIMLFVKSLAETLQADPNEVIQIAQQNPDALKTAVQVFQETQDIQQAALAFQQTLQLKVLAAKHGAKLKYIKSLKNQCAEDEELVYYKKGGVVDCGCMKKQQKGGKTTNDVVKKFKEKRSQILNPKTKSAKCGSKMKKHQQGGSLNEVSFYLKGTSKGGIKYSYTIKHPKSNSNFLSETFSSVPDKFGRHIEITRTISPSEDGTFNNDTTYRALSMSGDQVKGSSWNYRDNGRVYVPNNSGDRWMTPGKLLGRNQFKNWGDYFEYLLSLRNKQY